MRKRFAVKCTQNDRTKDMFPLAVTKANTRHAEKYQVTKAKTNRLLVSSIPSMQRELNQMKHLKYLVGNQCAAPDEGIFHPATVVSVRITELGEEYLR